MSACISSKGEYSSHTTTEGNFICDDCGVLDEDGLFAELAELRAEVERLQKDRDTAQEHVAYHLRDYSLNGEATGDLAVDMAAYSGRLRIRAEAAEAERDRARSLAATLEARLVEAEAMEVEWRDEVVRQRLTLAKLRDLLFGEPLIVHSVRRDMERTPGGRGGSLRHEPESFNAKTGRPLPSSGCPSDNLTSWLDALRAALKGDA